MRLYLQEKKSTGDISRLVLGLGIKSRSGSRSIRGEARRGEARLT
jgi:hypothetical protein